MSIFITSDLHFGHNRDFLYEPRGFSSIEEHDATIIKNINETVTKDDTLFILGDLMMNDNEHGIEMLKQINCEDVRVIIGNHDTPARIELYKALPHFTVLGTSAIIKHKKYNFLLSHYPTLTSNFDDDKKPSQRVWNICGHWHTKDKINSITNSIHCELDAWENYPINMDVIRELIMEKNTHE